MTSYDGLSVQECAHMIILDSEVVFRGQGQGAAKAYIDEQLELARITKDEFAVFSEDSADKMQDTFQHYIQRVLPNVIKQAKEFASA